MSDLDYNKIARILGGTLHEVGPQQFGQAPNLPESTAPHVAAPAPPEPAEVPKPLTDAALRRRVAEIDGWQDMHLHSGQLYGWRSGERNVVPHYESDLNAAEGAVRRWCERNGYRWTLCGDKDMVGAMIKIGHHRFVAGPVLPASHSHAAARAMSEALVKADDALNKNQ